MSQHRRTIAGAFVLAVLVSSSAWAERPAERAAQRQEAVRQLVRIEQRLANVQPNATADPVSVEIDLSQARTSLELAQKLLSRNDSVAARVLADQAERHIARAEGKRVPR
jgi:hypothetical protein